LHRELDKISIHGQAMRAELNQGKSVVSPPYYMPIIDIKEANKSSITLIGLEIAPVYMNARTGAPYPLILRELRASFSKVVRKSFFEFIRMHTSFNASNFQMLGTTTLDKR